MLCQAPIASDHRKSSTKRSNLTRGIEEGEIGLLGESMLGFDDLGRQLYLAVPTRVECSNIWWGGGACGAG